MWVALRLQTADGFTSDYLGPHVGVRFAPGIAGYLPVYETKEAAEKDYPDGPIKEIRFGQEAPEEVEA